MLKRYVVPSRTAMLAKLDRSAALWLDTIRE
jgi:hypothetical protein